jgi:hypothetical protein
MLDELINPKEWLSSSLLIGPENQILIKLPAVNAVQVPMLNFPLAIRFDKYKAQRAAPKSNIKIAKSLTGRR